MASFNKKGLLQAVCAIAFIMPAAQAVSAGPEAGVVHNAGSTFKTPKQELQEAHLIAAIIDNNLPRIVELVDAGVDVNANDGQPLATAADTGNLEAVRLLLDRGAKPDMDEGIALMMAADNARTDVVKLLLESNINPFLENIELFLEQMQVVKEDIRYESSKFNNPEYDEIVKLINDRRKELRPDYVPKIYNGDGKNKGTTGFKLTL